MKHCLEKQGLTRSQSRRIRAFSKAQQWILSQFLVSKVLTFLEPRPTFLRAWGRKWWSFEC
jgi:hypothetical protein